MSTWNTITVSGAPRLTEKRLLKAIARAGIDLWEQSIDEREDGWVITGHSKYEAEGLSEFGRDVSARHSGSRVEISEEWDTRDADEQGETERVYVGGEYVPSLARTSGLVPVNLAERIAAVRTALTGTGDLAEAARSLADGLDGIG